MKTVKILFSTLMLMLAVAIIPGCGKEDGEEPDATVTATSQEIQGMWHNTSFGTYRSVTFSGNKYSVNFMDVSTHKITDKENGTFILTDRTMTLTRTSGTDLSHGTLNVYWNSKMKNSLHIYPWGDFTKAN